MKSIRGKLFLWILPALIGALALLISFSTLIFRDTIYSERKLKQKHVVETAISVISHYYNLAKAGKMSETDAKEAAKLAVKSLRYETVEYFWINDDKLPYPTMVMHATNPALDGKVLDDPKYNCATLMETWTDKKITKTDGKKNLFQAAVEVANKDANGGFVQYLWPKPKPDGTLTTESYPKLSFVKKFQPWGWIVGSGVYIDDVQRTFMNKLFGLLIIGTITIAAAVVVFLFFSRSLSKPIKSLADRALAFGKGDLTVKFEAKG
ncbi:cache domain-containing protein, partial [Pseudothermotoga sp.]|uniref:cache domain-containing protein n=1 Tax=Pseudothermotoga sp. TaxID=2033661 RepID=UPI0031F5F623